MCLQYQSDCFQNRRPSRISPKTTFRRWSPYRIQKGYLCHLQWDKWSRWYHRWLSLAKLVPWEGNKYAATSTRAWLRTYCAWPNLGVGCELICLLGNIWEGIVAYGKRELTSPTLKNKLSKFLNWSGVMRRSPVSGSTSAPVAAWYAWNASSKQIREDA